MAPMIGMMSSPTSDVTIAPKAAPMMTPTARSITLPRIANFLNSSNIIPPLLLNPRISDATCIACAPRYGVLREITHSFGGTPPMCPTNHSRSAKDWACRSGKPPLLQAIWHDTAGFHQLCHDLLVKPDIHLR